MLKTSAKQSMLDIDFFRQDKFGYYQIDQFKTYSRFEAIEKTATSDSRLHWNFNDEIYGSYDWSQEPTESLSELYRQRAQQLRNQYDYLVLWFSGGADSTNVLNSFIENNIKLDEVASYVNYEADKDTYGWLNAEVYHVASAVANTAKLRQPWLLHTVVDQAKLTMEYFKHKSATFDWIYYVNTHVNPNACARRDIKLYVAHWKKMFDAGKKIGFIYGCDKPKLIKQDNKYYFRFHDIIDGSVNAETQMLNRPYEFNELFYWTPDLPKITIKQGHVVKNYLKGTTDPACFSDTNQHFHSFDFEHNGNLQYLTKSALHTLIYPAWTPVLYQFKAPNLRFSPRDSWFFKLPDSDSAKHAWKTGLKHRWQLTKNIAQTNPHYIKHVYGSMLGNNYFLGE